MRQQARVPDLTAAVTGLWRHSLLVAELKSTNARLVNVRSRLAAPQEQHDGRERLRLAVQQGTEEWRGILRQNPAQGRQVIAHLLGPITITVELGAVLADPGMDRFDPNDRRGKEGITAADVRAGIE